MPHIQQLDPHVADLIAAGEVVERPASVVKELVENAIDAGAKTVTVEIQHGGMTFLRVTDNGCGIAASEAEIAFLRHATSKIQDQHDLEAIGTLGFRGEALAAISAVSRVCLLTRTADAPLGVSLTLEGGVTVQKEEAGCPAGTTLIVRDLFYNTPARLKFVKKDAAEGAAVFAAVQRIALSHPELSVKFLRDGRQDLLTPGDGQLQSAAYSVLGRDIALGLIPVQSSGDGISVSGFVSLPACCRGSRGYQFFFVNGRSIKSRVIMTALEQAYQNQRMVGKFPACVLHLTVKCSAVDVNVHPAKQEVKFCQERQVFDAVYYAVKAALESDHTRPAASFPSARPRAGVRAVQTTAAEGGRKRIPARSGEEPVFYGPAREALPAKKPPVSAPFETAAYLRSLELDRDLPSCSASPAAGDREVLREGEIAQPEKPPAHPPEPEQSPGPLPEQAPVTVLTPPQEPPAPWRLVGELFRTYLVVEQGDKLLLIDKHAAHERMKFDALKAEGYTPMVQYLLTPVVFTPPAEEGEVLLSHRALLEQFGFSVEDFGGGALAVRQAPDYVDAGEIESTLSELASGLLDHRRTDPADARDVLLHTMACKAAIKGSQKNSPEELNCVAQAVLSGQVKYCPHGRPVAVELNRRQLEKQFKRI